MCIMKTVSAILVIFYAYLHAADNLKIKPPNILEDVVSDIGDTLSNVTHKIIPNCVFGVENVSVVLYTRNIPRGKNIELDEDICNQFDHSQPIFFLVHGFISNPNYTNSYKLSEALVKKGVTVFSLDWSDAACTTGLPVVKFLGYPSAVQNTREIGELMARYAMSLINKCNVSLDNITFVGHSLGAHVCGFASKFIQLNLPSSNNIVPLLFGVDPAQPLFLTNNCNNRLCKTDASTVLVLHTSSLGLRKPFGHLDFYYNGGYLQPNCNLDVACSHSSGGLYMAKIVEDSTCKFPGVPMSYMDINLPIFKPSYPKPTTTNCFLMNDTIILDKNLKLDDLKGKSYYMFVNSDTYCTKDNFNCQD